MKKSPYSRCSRCGGNMVHENYFGIDEEFNGLKCVMCGEVIDPVILKNRALMRTGPVMISMEGRGAMPKGIYA